MTETKGDEVLVISNIGRIDKNLLATGIIQEDNLCFYNVKEDPFTIYGLLPCDQGEPFRRIPSEIAQNISEKIWKLHTHTAGGRVRFRTNSNKIAIRAFMPDTNLMPHMPFLGSSGFDLYEASESSNTEHMGGEHYPPVVNWTYRGSFVPPTNRCGYFEAVVQLESREMRDLLINFPLYDNVDELWVGLESDALLLEGGKYRVMDPVIYYGSSITQGGCASRPGNTYQAIISRNLNCDHINLGFSGSAKGEQDMADYIAGLPMSVFVMDYDHNATSEELGRTHEAFFLTIREKHPDVPIVLVSMTDPPRTPQKADIILHHWEIIRRTYENALSRGDKLVQLVDGRNIFQCCSALNVNADSCTVDGVHPNDLGFACMAKVIGEAVKQALQFC